MGVAVAQASQRDTLRPGKNSPASRSSTSSNKPMHHESSRSHMASTHTLRPAHNSGQRETSRYEAPHPTYSASRNDYSFSPAATRHPGVSHAETSSRHTGAAETSTLANGQLVKTREVKPSQESSVPSSSTVRDLVRVPGSSHPVSRYSAGPSSAYNGQLRAPGSSNGRDFSGSDPMEISSFTSLELTRSDGSRLNVVQGFKIKIGGKSNH